MNDAQWASKSIVAFLKGPAKFLLLNGTYQNQKHRLALQCISDTYGSGTVLFRANSSSNLAMFLGQSTVSRPKFPMQLGKLSLYGDTINPKSWAKSPSTIGIGLVYPLDSVDADDGSACVQDLERRGAEKILLVTWTDNKSFMWTDHLKPVRVTYDSEAERPEYHKEMKRLEAETTRVKIPASLPSYAKQAAPERLIKVNCHNCRASRWAELNQPNPGRSALHNAKDGEFEAKCLMCGTILMDHYNW